MVNFDYLTKIGEINSKGVTFGKKASGAPRIVEQNEIVTWSQSKDVGRRGTEGAV